MLMVMMPTSAMRMSVLDLVLGCSPDAIDRNLEMQILVSKRVVAAHQDLIATTAMDGEHGDFTGLGRMLCLELHAGAQLGADVLGEGSEWDGQIQGRVALAVGPRGWDIDGDTVAGLPTQQRLLEADDDLPRAAQEQQRFARLASVDVLALGGGDLVVDGSYGSLGDLHGQNVKTRAEAPSGIHRRIAMHGWRFPGRLHVGIMQVEGMRTTDGQPSVMAVVSQRRSSRARHTVH